MPKKIKKSPSDSKTSSLKKNKPKIPYPFPAPLTALAWHLNDLLFILDKAGAILFEGPSNERLIGYGPGERAGKPLLDYVHPDDQSVAKAFLGSHTRRLGSIGTLEMRILHKNGSWHQVETTVKNLMDDPAIGGIFINARDITDRKKVEQALKDEENRFRNVAETASDGIITINEKDSIIFSNKAVERILGYSPMELYGKDLTDLMPPAYRTAHLNGMARYLAGLTPKLSWQAIEFPGLRKDGTRVSLEISLSEFIRGKERYFTAILRDITERKKEEEITLKYERLGAIGEMAAGMAHEIRNPLAAISGAAQYLKLKGFTDPPVLLQLDNILEQCERLKSLVDDTLQYARGNPSSKRTFQAPEVFQEALRLAQIQFGPAHSKVRVIWDLPAGDQSVLGDPGRIQQVLVNLILNAYQEMLDGGTLLLVSNSDERYHYFRVQDSAKGINDHDLPRIFEPFYTTKKTGSGLGLSISQKIAEDHQGRIEVQRLKPRGSAFILKLPRGKEK